MTNCSTIFLGLTALLAVGCTKPNNASCADDFCQDESLPFCDVDGSLGGDPNTCIAVECTPGEFEACRGDTELRCNSTGTNYDIGQCELGCDPATGCIIEVIDNDCTPGEVRCGAGTLETCNAEGEFDSEACAAGCVPGAEPHCAYAAPRFLPGICDAPATNQSSFSVASFSTDDDAFCNGGIVAQTDGPEICVVRYGQIIIPNTGSDVVVSGSRAVALVADEQLLVEGTLDISANGSTNGPGGGAIRSGGSTTPSSNPTGIGGGGAGFVVRGGSGGSPTVDGGAQNGGNVVGALLDTTLVGGTRPENGVALTGPPLPGTAGGAATLIACRGTVNVTGTIDAGGGGGNGGRVSDVATRFHGGAGGGSGGYAVLQGLTVSVTGRMFANGGAGGNGVPATQVMGNAGADGGRTVLQAIPSNPVSGEGIGGYGQAASMMSTMNGTKPSSGRSAGGGGGAMGRFLAITPPGRLPTVSTPNQSPQVLSFDTLELK